jgi:hypothetical protein
VRLAVTGLAVTNGLIQGFDDVGKMVHDTTALVVEVNVNPGVLEDLPE